MKKRIYFTGRNAALTLASGGVSSVLLIFVRAMSGSPYETVHICGISGLIPPAGIFAALWLIWYFLLGAQLVYALSYGGFSNVTALRGGIPWVACIFAGMFFYPVFFSSRAFFLGFLISLCVLILAFISLVLWRELPFSASVVPILYCLWMIYVSTVSFLALLNC